VSKAAGHSGRTQSHIQTVAGEARVEEIARMMGGAQGAHGTAGQAHAQELLALATGQPTKKPKARR
jgi:DNA repair protein RecN (Recombination protein N)